MKNYSSDLKRKLVAHGLMIAVGELTRDVMRKGLPTVRGWFSKPQKKTEKYDEDEEGEED